MSFTPAPGVVGTTSVAVTLSDSGGGADTSAGQTFEIAIVPASATGMVISQLAFGGMNGAGGDFIEIYNAGPSITLNGWSLHLVDDDITNLVSLAIPDGTTIDRGEHWLFAAGLVDGVTANQVIVFPTWFPTADPANPLGVGLYDGAAYVDQVGNRGSVHFSVNAAKLSEGNGLSVLEAVGTDRSWERRNGGSAGHCIDTADNGADFTLNFGAANVVPHNNLNDDDCGALPAPPAAANTLVISEFRHDGDGAGDNDFVEIFNPTPIDVDVAGWFLHVTDGGGGEHVEFTFPAATTIRGGEHFLIGGASFVGADAPFSGDGIKGDTRIRLKEVTGTLLDEVSMGVVSGGSVDPLPKLGGRQDHSYHRLHDGCTDTDSNYDDFEYLGTSTPTPLGALSPCPNAAPAAVDDPLTAGAYDTPNDVNLVVTAADGVLANDSDVDLDALVVLPGLTVPPTNGALLLNADGSFTYDPDAGFVGVDSFTYTVSDGALSSTATAYITVGPP